VLPVSGHGDAEYEPIWAEDAAAAVMGVLGGHANGRDHVELAGPERLTYDGIVQTFLAAKNRRRPVVHVPLPVVKAGLKAVEEIQGSLAFATWDEAELMEIPMLSERGTADAEALGVRPQPMQWVLRRG
jgi:NADH dehydrogenase